MRLSIRVTFKCTGGPEYEVYCSDVVRPDAVSLTLSIAERTAKATLAALRISSAQILEYLGPSLIATIDL